MKLRFLIITAMMALATLQLNAQEQDYEYKYEAVSLKNECVIVHSRSYSLNPFDYSDNKTVFHFEVPVNTVAIMYAYSSESSEVQIPELKLCAGITQCIGSIASLGNRSLGAGIDKIAEGLNGMSIPSGTGDVDIYYSVNKKWMKLFQELDYDEIKDKFYDEEWDLLNRSYGSKVIRLKKQVKESYPIYLGLLNNYCKNRSYCNFSHQSTCGKARYFKSRRITTIAKYSRQWKCRFCYYTGCYRISGCGRTCILGNETR